MTLNISFAGIEAWFRGKNITAHSIALAAIAFATAYTSDQQFRDFILGLVKDHPKIAADLTLAVGIILKYSHSSSAAGTVATAEKVLASPNPPTPAAIAAATPTLKP
jgi:hypothetical protein